MKFILKIVILLFVSTLVTSVVQAKNDYVEKTAKRNLLEKKILEAKKVIKERIKEKKQTKNTKKQGQIFATIVDLHKGLLKDIEEYNKVIKEIKYRFPEKGDKTERKYLPIRPQTVEEIEQETGIENVLSRVKHKVDQKYKVFTIEDKEKKKKKPKGPHKKEKDTLKRIRIER